MPHRPSGQREKRVSTRARQQLVERVHARCDKALLSRVSRGMLFQFIERSSDEATDPPIRCSSRQIGQSAPADNHGVNELKPCDEDAKRKTGSGHDATARYS